MTKPFCEKALPKTKDYDVRVFCPQCKNGDNWIWKGSLIDWGIMLSYEAKSNKNIPAWYRYAMNHQNHHGHKIMVEYPDVTIPLDLSSYEEG